MTCVNVGKTQNFINKQKTFIYVKKHKKYVAMYLNLPISIFNKIDSGIS